MKDDPTTWQRMRFKNNKVWLAVGPEGGPIARNGKVLIKYQLDQDYQYWIHPGAIKPLDTDQRFEQNPQSHPSGRSSVSKVGRRQPADAAMTVDCRRAICMFTDGASAGNPGPSGIGIVLRHGDRTKEISEYIGRSTNNIAELKAIQRGLAAIKQKGVPVRVFTDSNYAYGLIALGWKAKKNTALVAAIRREVATFEDIEFIKVKGHAGCEGNERADHLATSAIQSAVQK